MPCMTPYKSYVTEYEGVDFAIGFEKIEDIKRYLSVQDLDYDFLFVDIDSAKAYQQVEARENNKNFFVTAFDNFSLKKGLEIVGQVDEKMLMTKVLFSREMSQEEEDYLNFLSFYYSIQWEKEKVYFPYDMGDSTAIIEGQRTAKIRFKFLSDEYKKGLEDIAKLIDPNANKQKIKSILKNI